MKSTLITLILTLSFLVIPLQEIHAATPTDNTALIQKLLAQIVILQTELAKLRGTTLSCTFTRLLIKGAQGTDVVCLQNFLKSKGHFQGNPTGLFGPMTESAVATWQRSEGIVAEPWEYGRFGEQSRGVYMKTLTVLPLKSTPTTFEPVVPMTPISRIPSEIPTIKSYSPRGTIVYTDPISLTVTTDIPSTCKFGIRDDVYAALPQNFLGSDTVDHIATVTLPLGTARYQYYVRCMTSVGKESVVKKISFRLKASTTPETIFTSTTTTTQVVPAYSLPPAPRIWRMGFFWPLTAKSYPVDLIPWSKYTHVSEMQIMPTESCSINDTTYKVKDSQAEFIKAGHEHGVRVLITLGDSKSGRYLEKCTNAANIDAFVLMLKNYVVTNQYDGLDIDWEESFIPSQYKNLIVKLRTVLPSHVLTTDIGVYQRNAVSEVQDKLDRVNLMSYDMHMTDYSGKQLKDTWFNSAILSANDTLNHKSAEADLYYLLASKIAPQKINLGLPFYGYEIKGCQESLSADGTCAHRITAPLQSVATTGVQVKQISYADVLTKYADKPILWNTERGAPYISTEDAFVTFSNPEQMKVAVKLLLDKGLGGIMTFSLFQEYVGTEIGNGRYPLSSAMYDELQSHSALSTLVETSSFTSAQAKIDLLQDLLDQLRTLQAEVKKLKN